ncbi:MAG: hypothetical protein QF775_01150 [archaeon]|jgi:hypothetical protein|nr:hypothetical protein [Euryarchaeota archaeon]MDP6704074.1 hypothetical protein [archaeon]|tara:strand:- start:916 stop:2115 length:1200 start_codon:yes stop_codon:yes gene_type:complete
MKLPPVSICPFCKGKHELPIPKHCKVFLQRGTDRKLNQKFSKDFSGPSTSVFVGRYGYPNVNIGPSGVLDHELAGSIDNPSEWITMDYTNVIEMRSFLLRSKTSQGIYSKERVVQDSQLLSMASKPTEVEMNFRKKPNFNLSFSNVIQPMGPTAELEKLSLTENPKIARKVDYIVSDELKASDQAGNLYEEGLDIYKITSILSSGTLGLKQKLVPTRWSITATDDIVAKNLLPEVRCFKSLDTFKVFEAEHFDNHFVIVLAPGKWEFENFEAWAPGSNWEAYTDSLVIEEYEPHEGRTKYAEKQAGGYYAARLPAVEYLHSIRKQARVLSFREISEGYSVPLGVWVVRETVRQAFKKKPLEFSTMEEVLKYAESRLKVPMQVYKKKSALLQQRRLVDFS